MTGVSVNLKGNIDQVLFRGDTVVSDSVGGRSIPPCPFVEKDDMVTINFSYVSIELCDSSGYVCVTGAPRFIQ